MPEQLTTKNLPKSLSPKTGTSFSIQGEIAEVIQNTIVDGVIFTDRQGIVRYLNRAAKTLLGVKTDVVGVPRRKLITNAENHLKYKLEYLFDPIKCFKDSLNGSLISGLVIKVTSNPTKYLDTTYVPVHDGSGQIIGVLADFRDVSLEKVQQDEIQNQLKISNSRRKRWDAIFNSVEEGICIVDKNYRILEINPAMEVTSGFSEKEVLGKKYYEVFKCHDLRGHLLGDSLVRKAFITGEPVAYDEHLHTNRDDSELWVGTTCAPLVSTEGENECLVVVRDVNNYKQVEKLKSEFVSIASHELRTPLTIINGYLSLLNNGDLGSLTDPDRAEQHKKVINKVFLETKRLSSLVEDLLNISRIEEGRLKLDISKVDLGKLVQDTVNDYLLLAKGKNLNLFFEPLMEKYLVDCDAGKIKQVLTNLIDNAIKYTEKGEISINIVKSKDQAIVSVKDTGIGIPLKLQDIIFEKFQQAPGSYLKENRGTGLGLFIVKGIVDLHQGEVWVNSIQGKGSTFSFSLPLADKS